MLYRRCRAYLIYLTIINNRNNYFPLQITHNLKKKIIRTQKTKNTPTQTQIKKWITFTYHSPLIHKVTNLFKRTELNKAFRTC